MVKGKAGWHKLSTLGVQKKETEYVPCTAAHTSMSVTTRVTGRPVPSVPGGFFLIIIRKYEAEFFHLNPSKKAVRHPDWGRGSKSTHHML